MRRTDPSDWMWAQAVDLIGQAERLHRQFFHLRATERSRRASVRSALVLPHAASSAGAPDSGEPDVLAG